PHKRLTQSYNACTLRRRCQVEYACFYTDADHLRGDVNDPTLRIFRVADATALIVKRYAQPCFAASYHHHEGHWYHGHYWEYGVGACWRPTPVGFVWVCAPY